MPEEKKKREPRVPRVVKVEKTEEVDTKKKKQSSFAFGGVDPKAKKSSSTEKSPAKATKTEPKKEEPESKETKPKRLTKKAMASMTEEQIKDTVAKRAEERRQKRLLDRLNKQAEEEDLRQASETKVTPEGEEWTEGKTVFESKNGWVVVLTPRGDLYQEPVPRYCSPSAFTAILCSLPSVEDEGGRFKVEAEVSVTSCDKGEIVTATYYGQSVRNPFADLFKIQNATKIVGGNLVFTDKDGKGFTKAKASSMVKWVIGVLSKEEKINID